MRAQSALACSTALRCTAGTRLRSGLWHGRRKQQLDVSWGEQRMHAMVISEFCVRFNRTEVSFRAESLLHACLVFHSTKQTESFSPRQGKPVNWKVPVLPTTANGAREHQVAHFQLARPTA